MNSISNLSPGQEATISKIHLSGRQRQHVEDLGFVPGASIHALYRSPGGDPPAYSIAGSVIALRREDACHILCNPRSCGSTKAGCDL